MTVDCIKLADITSFLPEGNLVIITDSLVQKLYGASFPPAPCILVPQSEPAKSFDILQTVLGKFAAMGMDRNWHVLAIGGGSISDLGGFAAHIWMRGVKCFFAPTTLLSMVDASIGGKNGIDFLGYKNVIGSFQEPERIFCDITTLHSLPEIQFASGMAEVIKHAVITGEPYFGLLESFSHLKSANLDDSMLANIVTGSQNLKLSIISRDPLERGERRILNLGHTFGHAIEAATGLPHGHSVSLGLVLSCRLSMKRKGLSESDYSRICALLTKAGLPNDPGRIPGSPKPLEIISKLQMDKKRKNLDVCFAMPQTIGKVIIETLPIDYLSDFLLEVL